MSAEELNVSVAPERIDLEAVIEAIEPDSLDTLGTGEIAVEGRSDDKRGSGERESQAQKALRFVEEAGVELFHAPDNTPYARVPLATCWAVWRLRSTEMRRWLDRLYYQAEGRPLNNEGRNEVLGVLAAKALFDGSEKLVNVRVARMADRVYLDLCDEQWRVVEITTEGWQVVENPPVCFRRAPGMAPLPEPERGGSVGLLRPLVNVASDHDFRLLVGWLLAALTGEIKYPILVIQGPHGSAKSTASRLARSLVDPSTSLVRTAPREERDLMIAATNGHVVAIDNLSGLPTWLSDALCRLSTGGGFSVRALYTDDEERIFEACRPIILNGIDDIATRQDLVDRSLVLSLQSIPEEERREDRAFWADFQKAQPLILGALLDAVSGSLARYQHVKLERLPRMADFAVWVTAAEPALGWKDGAFMEAYAANREEAVTIGLEADPVALAIKKFMDKRIRWEGTASELRLALAEVAGPETASNSWPKAANALSNRIRRIQTPLAAWGIEVGSGHSGRGITKSRTITLTRCDKRSRKIVSNTSPPGDSATFFGGDLGSWKGGI